MNQENSGFTLEHTFNVIAWTSAQELLSAIEGNLVALSQKNSSPRFLMFRGCLAEHTLSPSLDRADEASMRRRQSLGTEDWAWGTDRIPNNSSHKYLLFRTAISTFYRLAVTAGHPLPHIDHQLHVLLTTEDARVIYPELLLAEGPFLQVIALAQHLGVPTPFLDWTEDPYVALYFASKSALNRILETKECDKKVLTDAQGLAFWFTTQELPHDTSRSTVSLDNEGNILKPKYPYEIFVINPLRHFNANLTAQKGKFTLLINPSESGVNKYLGLPGIEDIWQDLTAALDATEMSPFKGRFNLLTKHTAPLSAAPALMRQLRLRGYSGARLFPSLEGCITSMEEEFLIRQAEDKLKALGITP